MLNRRIFIAGLAFLIFIFVFFNGYFFFSGQQVIFLIVMLLILVGLLGKRWKTPPPQSQLLKSLAVTGESESYVDPIRVFQRFLRKVFRFTI